MNKLEALVRITAALLTNPKWAIASSDQVADQAALIYNKLTRLA